MVIEEALQYHLVNDTDIKALISSRAYPNVIPQDAALPALAYLVISRPGGMAHDGPTGIAWPRFQITAQADTFSEIVDLTNKVRIALDGFTGTMGGAGGVTIEGSFVKDVRDGYEFATERETRRLDVIIWYQEYEAFMADDLEKHFDFKFDDRYHCKYCGYDTQLVNKARRHIEKRHKKELAKRFKKPVKPTVKTQVLTPETKKKEERR